MLKDADFAPVTNALEDESSQVRDAARRVMLIVQPLLSQPGAGTDFGNADLEVRGENFGAAAHVPQWTGPSEWDTPEHWRRDLGAESDSYRRLMAAAKLSIVGEPATLEDILDDIEREPMDLEGLGRFREARLPAVAPRLIDRLCEIADDGNRRGDVRQLAYLLATREGEGDFSRPHTPDLIKLAESKAERYLENDEAIGIHHSEIEAFRYLDPERAALLITVSFERCSRATLSERDWPYAVGNDIRAMLAAFGPAFVPDIAALFEIYAFMYPHFAAARAEWYEKQDDSIVFSGQGLAASWQIAWTVGRAGWIGAIAELAPFMGSSEEQERVAVLGLTEDMIRFLSVPYYPLYGGVTAPEMNLSAVVRSASSSIESSESKGYTAVRVFYGTDRQRTGSNAVSQWYGAEAGDLEVGLCTVSIPDDHEIGKLESPAYYRSWNWRANPQRYVVLQEIRTQERSEFCEELRASVACSTEKHALVFVHGYRVSFEDAARRTAQLATDLKIETPIFFSWPSRARLFGYAADAVMAQRSVPRLAAFLDIVAAHSGAEVVHLIAHSMGSLALANAIIEYLQTRPAGLTSKFRELILAAPDIDAWIFREQIVPKIAAAGPSMTLYASRRDYALLTSEWLRKGFSRADFSRAGFVDGDAPLVVDGVETIDVSAVNTECLWGLLQGHSYVGDRAAIVQDIFELLRFGKRASDRFGHRKAYVNGLPYWIMQPRSG
jgi:esterase/lipase superfamily enzyme